jgi:hypothetical protein
LITKGSTCVYLRRLFIREAFMCAYLQLGHELWFPVSEDPGGGAQQVHRQNRKPQHHVKRAFWSCAAEWRFTAE